MAAPRSSLTNRFLVTNKGVVHFDEEPIRLASSSLPHADERELALKHLAVQRKLQMPGVDTLRHCLWDRLVGEHVIVGVLIPDAHRPSLYCLAGRLPVKVA